MILPQFSYPQLFVQEYKREGINIEHIAFVDNKETVDLIEGRVGILTELDQQVC
jgi:myosin heavy subunit